jgi:hypothetical protein
MAIPWNKGKKGVQIPWNKGKKGVQSSWNKGKTGIYSEETKRRIGLAASIRNKGRKLTRLHKKRISESRKEWLASVKICSNCSIKSKWMYGVTVPNITSYTVWLCDNCLLSYFRSGEELEVVA